jgi:hypothetical protein
MSSQASGEENLVGRTVHLKGRGTLPYKVLYEDTQDGQAGWTVRAPISPSGASFDTRFVTRDDIDEVIDETHAQYITRRVDERMSAEERRGDDDEF